MKKSRKRKLIVIDGGDGSGKNTQAKLLVGRLKKRGVPVKLFSFPRYKESFFGEIIGCYLRGEFGPIEKVSPYLIALAYADDRRQTQGEIEQFLEKGGVVICDRYVTSSMAHLSANLPEDKRNSFINWIDQLEYEQHKMPRPDEVIYLYIPWKQAEELINKGIKAYKYNDKADIHEASNHHRIETEKMYLRLANEHKNWKMIDCMENGKLLPIEDIEIKIDKSLTLVV